MADASLIIDQCWRRQAMGATPINVVTNSGLEMMLLPPAEFTAPSDQGIEGVRPLESASDVELYAERETARLLRDEAAV